MGLKKMIEMAAPPKHPIHTGTPTSWREVQRHVGGVLPACLDEYGRIYGSGEFASDNCSLLVLNPHDPLFAKNVEWYCENYCYLREDSPEFYPYACFPDEYGLFPIAILTWSPAMTIYLQLTGDPENYSIVFDDRCTGHIEFPNISLFDFVNDVLNNRVQKDAFAIKNIRFVPKALHE